MELNLRQVAEIFSVTENQIIEWINEDNLPAELVTDQYRFHRSELLEWAALRRRPFKTSIYVKVNGDLRPAATHLADALEIGGVLSNVGGRDLREVFQTALLGLPVPEAFGLDTLCELILAREELGSTTIGKGIAVPHPRQPVILTVAEPVVRLCYLTRPLDIPPPDGQPVDKLFLILCPTVHDHLQLLARLGAVLGVEAVLTALNQKAGAERLIPLIREAGRQFSD